MLPGSAVQAEGELRAVATIRAGTGEWDGVGEVDRYGRLGSRVGGRGVRDRPRDRAAAVLLESVSRYALLSADPNRGNARRSVGGLTNGCGCGLVAVRSGHGSTTSP